MSRMLQSMKHRGPDSTGYALYRPPPDDWVMHVKLADANDAARLRVRRAPPRNRGEVERRLRRGGRASTRSTRSTEYAFDAMFDYDGDLKPLADRVEDVSGAEVLSLGHTLEIIKDLGDAETVAGDYGLAASTARTRSATAGWRPSPTSTSRAPIRTGRIRSPTSPSSTTASSPTTTSGAGAWSAAGTASSPSATPRSSPSTSPSGSRAATLEEAMSRSLEELDGVFTYLCVTGDALGMAKDELAAKPLVLYEADDVVALASEEIAIRAVLDREIDTYDPYESEVMVWQR